MSLEELEKLTPIQTRIFEELYCNNSLTRSELVVKMNKPRTTIYDNLKILEEKKLIERYSENNGKGRPLTVWHILRSPICELLKKNEKKHDFIQNKDSHKKIFQKYKREASLRYARKKREQKLINDRIRPQTVMPDYFNNIKGIQRVRISPNQYRQEIDLGDLLNHD